MMNSPLFRTAADYNQMFTSVLKRYPGWDSLVSQEIAWAKNILKKNDRIVWWLRWFKLGILAKGAFDDGRIPREDVEAYQAAVNEYNAKAGGNIASRSTIPALSFQSPPRAHADFEHFFGTPDEAIQDSHPRMDQTPYAYRDALSEMFDAWTERNAEKNRALPPLEGDQIILTMPNGWAWWKLSRGVCDAEAKAMGHCGNGGSNNPTSETILSYREPVTEDGVTGWKPHLTFILDANRSIGEMKGRFNEKPQPEFYPAIVALLRSNEVGSIKGGGYLSENNFSMLDLPEGVREELYKEKPDLMSIPEYYKRFGATGDLPERIENALDPDGTEINWNPRIKRFSVVGEELGLQALLSIMGDDSVKEAAEAVFEAIEADGDAAKQVSYLPESIQADWREALAALPAEQQAHIAEYLEATYGYTEEWEAETEQKFDPLNVEHLAAMIKFCQDKDLPLELANARRWGYAVGSEDATKRSLELALAQSIYVPRDEKRKWSGEWYPTVGAHDLMSLFDHTDEDDRRIAFNTIMRGLVYAGATSHQIKWIDSQAWFVDCDDEAAAASFEAQFGPEYRETMATLRRNERNREIHEKSRNVSASTSVKTADWHRAEDLRKGDLLAFPAPVFCIDRIYREGDEIVVLGRNGVTRRFAPDDEVNFLRKTAATSGFPTFPEFLKASGGVEHLVSELWADDWSYYTGEFEEEGASSAEEFATRCLAPAFRAQVARFKRARFPRKIYRAVGLHSIKDLRTEEVGIYWAWNAKKAEIYGNSHGDKFVLEALVKEDNVDWIGTIQAAMNPYTGEEEGEITLKPGQSVEVLRYGVKNESGSVTWTSYGRMSKTAAPLHDEAKSRTFYHGTSSQASADEIIRNGIQPREITMPDKANSKSQLAPAKGRVYFTNDIGYAAIYALGGDYFGTSAQPSTNDREGKPSPYGYIFEVSGADLIGDVVPDEDSIGAMCTDLFTVERAKTQLKELHGRTDPRSLAWIKSFQSDLSYHQNKDINLPSTPASVRGDLMRCFNTYATDGQKMKIFDGFIGVQAQIGKKLQRYLQPATMKWMLDNGAHTAHQGAIQVERSWRFKKADAVKVQAADVLSICEPVAVPQMKTATMEVKTAMQITVPPEEIENGHFWQEPPAGAEEFWAFRYPVKAKIGDRIQFNLNKKPIAEAIISRIEKPGESSCDETGRFKNKWKVFWTQESFRKEEAKTAALPSSCLTLYHGTDATKVLPGHPKGVYLAETPEDAAEYGATVYEYAVSLSRSLVDGPLDSMDAKRKGDLLWILESEIPNEAGDLQQWLSHQVIDGGLRFPLLLSKDVLKRMKQAGYDSTWVHEPFASTGRSLLVVNARCLKSLGPVTGGKTASAIDPDRFAGFLMALRAWGDNTIQDRAKKEADLLGYRDVASNFKGKNGLVYRGDQLDEQELEDLKAGRFITKPAHGLLQSFSRTRAGAQCFAEYADTGSGVLFRSEQEVFVDFTEFAAYMRRTGQPIAVDENDYALSDPIREREVICFAKPLVIDPADVVKIYEAEGAESEPKTASLSIEQIGGMTIPLYDHLGKPAGTGVIRDTPYGTLNTTFYALKRKRSPEAKQQYELLARWGDYLAQEQARAQSAASSAKSTGRGDYQFVTSCIEASPEDILSMVEARTESTLKELTHHCAGIKQWASAQGFDKHLRLEDEPYVQYYRSTYHGKPCYYIRFSGIEYVWVLTKSLTASTEPQSEPVSSITDTPAFKAWFGASKVVDASGKPMVMFHGTPHDFKNDQFQVGGGGRGSTESLGFHFGSSEAANARLDKGMKNYDAHWYNWNVMPVYLRITNPLRIGDAGAWHSPARVAHWLETKGGFDRAPLQEALTKTGHTAKMRAIKKVIEDAGYDGIVYHNEHEGGGDSWIALDARQIKSALGNGGDFNLKSRKLTATTVATPGGSYPPVLRDAEAIAEYIDGISSGFVDTEFIAEYFHGCHAVLTLVPTSEIHEGATDGNVRSVAKERRYQKLSPDTIPPLVVMDGSVEDGNHRFRVGLKQGKKEFWCYVVIGDDDDHSSPKGEEKGSLLRQQYWEEWEKKRNANGETSEEGRKVNASAVRHTFYHGSRWVDSPDALKPNSAGILWMADKAAARSYLHEHGKGTIFEIRLRPDAVIVALGDLSVPMIREFKDAFEVERVARGRAAIPDMDWPEWATFSIIEADAAMTIPFFRDRGVDAVKVRDGSSSDLQHDSVALLNMTAVESMKVADTTKAAAITPTTTIFYHGTAAKFDLLKPNEHGIIWLGDKKTAMTYAKMDSQFRSAFNEEKWPIRILPVKISGTAKIVDLRDRTDPVVTEFYSKLKENSQQDTTHNVIEGQYRWAVEWFRSKGVDGIMVTDDTGKKDGQHLSLALINSAAATSSSKVAAVAADLQAVISKWEALGLTIDISQDKSPRPTVLHRVLVPKEKRQEGLGTAFMEDLVRWADATGTTLALTPSKDFGASSVARLIVFYQRFGFKRNRGRMIDFTIKESMVRRPKG